MKNDDMKRKLRILFDSLTKERETFTLPLRALLQYKLLVTREKEGEIIGIAGIHGGARTNMLFVVVKSKYQGKKIGQELTKEVIEQAIKRNYGYLSLTVFESNARAIRIFRKLGFRVLYTSLMNGRKMYFMILPLNQRGIIHEKLFVFKHKLRSLLCGGIVGFRHVHESRVTEVFVSS